MNDEQLYTVQKRSVLQIERWWKVMEIKWLVAPDIKRQLAALTIQRWFFNVQRCDNELELVLENEAAAIIQRAWHSYSIKIKMLQSVIEEEAAGMIQVWYRMISWMKYGKMTRRILLRLKWDIRTAKASIIKIESEIEEYTKAINLWEKAYADSEGKKATKGEREV